MVFMLLKTMQVNIFPVLNRFSLLFPQQKLEENDDDSFLDSEWADSHALKRHFHGVKDIKWRPK